METNRKELEQVLRSLKPAGLSESTLNRLERAMIGSTEIHPSLQVIESQLQNLRPIPFSETALEPWMKIVGDVPFALDRKVLLFPGARREIQQASSRQGLLRRLGAIAAMAALGSLLALWTPERKIDSPAIAQANPQAPGSQPPVMASPNGIVTTSFGTDMERAADEGVIWTPDHQPKRVLRFEYQDRVLVRDKNGVDRMLFIPREELFVVPEKVD
ncbi:MAG: hypothetical protein RI957_1301 [Verrucomicrobiota bacterium]|jgi:hypothetical protein